MTTFFLWCGVLGGAVLVLQLVAGVVGMGDVHGHDVSSHHAGTEGLNLLSIRSLAAGLAFFGIAGLAARSFGAPVAFAAAVVAGLAAAFGVAAIVRAFRRLEHDATLALGSAVGATGTVYLSIPGRRSGVGKVHITVQNRLVECLAVTTEDALPTGASVLVIDLQGNDTVVVVRNPILLNEVSNAAV